MIRRLPPSVSSDLRGAIAQAKACLPICSVDEFMCRHKPPECIGALDIGDKFVGFALSDQRQTLVMPYTGGLLRRDSPTRRSTTNLLRALRQELALRGVVGLVVGYPVTVEHQREEHQCLKTLHFLRILTHPSSGIAVDSILLWNEMYTTQRAKHLLYTRDVSLHRRRERVDHVAAAYLLQNFIETRQIELGNRV